MVVAKTVTIERDDIVRVEVQGQRWYTNVAVRAGRTFLQSFVAFASILLVGSLVVDASNWEQWLELTFLLSLGKKTLVCFIVALVTAFWSAIQNLLELANRMDEKKPELRG